MRALCFDGKLAVRGDLPVPSPPPAEALVRVTLSGICRTDLEIVSGYLSFRGVMGHEFVGVVEKADGSPEWIGRRVVGEINAACGVCPSCRANRPTHCPDRTTLGISGRDGSFAEYLCLPVRNLKAVPDGVNDEAAVLVEPLAAACEITEAVHIRPTDRAVVLGDGKLGLLCAQVLQLTGCDLLAIGHHPESLSVLARRGIRTALAGSEAAHATADIVVEATGVPEGYEVARRLVRPRGTIVLKSTYHGQIEANLTMAVVDEITLVGSRCGPFEPALRLLRQNLVDVTPMIHARYRLADGVMALDRAAESGVLKVLLEP